MKKFKEKTNSEGIKTDGEAVDKIEPGDMAQLTDFIEYKKKAVPLSLCGAQNGN